VIVTTSRDPSPGTRRFARTLASFLSLPYVNRGKSGAGEEGEAALVVVEGHGNPSGIIKRVPGGREESLHFRISGGLSAGRIKKEKPVVCGPGGAARSIASFFELEWAGESPSPAGGRDGLPPAKGASAHCRRMISVAPGWIDFIDNGAVRFRLKR